MNRYIVFAVVLLCSLVACRDKQLEINLIPVKEFDINVGYNINIMNTGICKDGDTELIYFANMDLNRLRFFDFDGNLKQETSLESVVVTEYGTDIVKPISLDTILISRFYPENELYVLNGKGECWQQINFDSLVGNTDFEYRIMLSRNPLYKDKIIFKSAPVGFVNLDSYNGDRVSYLRDWHNMQARKPYILELSNIFSDNVGYKYGLDGFCGRFRKDDYETNMLGAYSFVNNRIFVYTEYSDTLYCLNNKTLGIDKKVKIDSKYTTIGKNKPRYIDKKSISDKSYYTLFQKGAIAEVRYYPKKDIYILGVSHDKPKDKPRSENSGYSLIFLDKDLNVIGEYLWNMKGSMIGLSEDGILVLNDVESDRKLKKIVEYRIDY